MNEWIKPVRTALQILIPLVALFPVLIPALGISTSVGVGATLLGASAILSRLMQIPAVEIWLHKLGIDSPEVK